MTNSSTHTNTFWHTKSRPLTYRSYDEFEINTHAFMLFVLILAGSPGAFFSIWKKGQDIKLKLYVNLIE